ncbi:BlaI/MecI/CopY family transcriptional regulator [uncultured Dubosiella sp.]|uniref:BlaI/MecI/CopY family transcriptional regulator n=1 Tax=uncultured Dubosiella sp. TaxID=1937011 RepID=UPI0025B2C80E|nr:BlaI/MecI/CopY family transcriptional regulator [uncultured Dubosiella sp.]
MKTLTGKEFEVMKVLWDQNESVSAAKIQEALPDTSIYSVQQVLRKLLKENWVRIEKTEILVKSLTRFFAPVVSESEYVRSFISPQSTFELTSQLIQETEDPQALARIEALIEAKKKQWQGEDG